MLPSFARLSVNAINDDYLEHLHDSEYGEYVEQISWTYGVSYLGALLISTLSGKRKRPVDDNPTLTKAMFGKGPCTPASLEQTKALLSLTNVIYKAKQELLRFQNEGALTESDKKQLTNERQVFRGALTLCIKAFECEIQVETRSLYNDSSFQSQENDYLKYLQNLSKRVERILTRNGENITKFEPWQLTLFRTRTVKRDTIPALHVRDAMRTLFYHVNMHAGADTLPLKAATQFSIDMFGMNAKTWHSLQVATGKNPWSWLALLPNDLKTETYTDDLTDLDNIVIHLQEDRAQGILSWRPDVKELTVSPNVLVFRAEVFLGYYYYTGFIRDDDPRKPPHVKLRRIS